MSLFFFSKNDFVFNIKMYTHVYINIYLYIPSKRIKHIPSNDCGRKSPPTLFFGGEGVVDEHVHPPGNEHIPCQGSFEDAVSFSQGPFSTSMLIVARVNNITHHVEFFLMEKTHLKPLGDG